MAEIFEAQGRKTVILLNNFTRDDRSNSTPPDTTPSSSATPPDSDMPSTDYTPTPTSSPTTIKHFPQELKDMIAAEMLPELLLSPPISTTNVNLVLDLEELDELETAYTLHTIGIALPPPAKAWMQVIDAKEVVLAILDTDITISASDKLKGRIGSGLLPKCKSAKLLLNFFQDHLICKCLGAAFIKMDINIKLRHGHCNATHVRIENVWPKGNAIPGLRVDDIIRRAVASCGKTYSGRGVVEKLMFVLHEVLAPVEKRAREEAAKAVTLQGLPQELKDDIVGYILPLQLQSAPPTSTALTLTLDLDDFEGLEAAYALRAMGIKLPPSTEAWVQAIEAKKVALIILIDANATLKNSKNDRAKPNNDFLRLFSSITLRLIFDAFHITSYTLDNDETKASLKMTFHYDHWVLSNAKWTGKTFGYGYRPYSANRGRAPVWKIRREVNEIARCAMGSCGKTYTVRGVAEKVLFLLRESLDEVESEAKARGVRKHRRQYGHEIEDKKEEETPHTLLTLPQELLDKIIAFALPSALCVLAFQYKPTKCGIGFFVEPSQSWRDSLHLRRVHSKVKKAVDEGMKKIDTLEIAVYGCSSKEPVWKGDEIPLGCITDTEWESFVETTPSTPSSSRTRTCTSSAPTTPADISSSNTRMIAGLSKN
ncbi:hypothetical protein PRZ48_008939 [Zasmidium cellare]|uniref:F-box domain-containing protein n=1 Tax=Zasmidium cellare TaxID=395010 RepID=A0ABR0EGW7_ZASCE|nr:hypothetical protein PRZ48_008939 [Zasmidium cellare]